MVQLQGGEYCKKCNFNPEKRYSLEIDHINNDPNHNRPANKQLLCGECNKVKELEYAISQRNGVNMKGGVVETRASECLTNQTPTNLALRGRFLMKHFHGSSLTLPDKEKTLALTLSLVKSAGEERVPTHGQELQRIASYKSRE